MTFGTWHAWDTVVTGFTLATFDAWGTSLTLLTGSAILTVPARRTWVASGTVITFKTHLARLTFVTWFAWWTSLAGHTGQTSRTLSALQGQSSHAHGGLALSLSSLVSSWAFDTLLG